MGNIVGRKPVAVAEDVPQGSPPTASYPYQSPGRTISEPLPRGPARARLEPTEARPIASERCENGRMKRDFANGDYYVGDWDGKRPHGFGMYCYSGGSPVYEGAFFRGMRHGKGTAFDEPDLAAYRGSYVLGRRQGHGEAKFHDGATYTGQWRDDRQHGHGQFDTYGEYSETYRGPFRNGVRHGTGDYWWDGNYYKQVNRAGEVTDEILVRSQLSSWLEPP